MAKDFPSDDIQGALKTIVEHFDKEDQTVRERQVRTWKKLKYYWDGFHNIWWSEVAHDWKIFDQVHAQDNNDAAYYDKNVNVFRAYLESIFAALSVTVPGVVCAPDDADNPLDISTAKAGNKIAELIYKHNDAPLLWLHALFILGTEGMVAAYSYPKEDEKYGMYEAPKYEKEEVEEQLAYCPECQAQLPDYALTELERNEYMPDNEDALAHNLILNKGEVLCPECLALIDPEYRQAKFIVSKVVGVTNKPKTRQCIEVYGGLYVKVSNYARKQEDCPSLIFSYETHYTNAIERYKHLEGKIGPSQGGTGYDVYERWARLSTQYNGEYPTTSVTVRNAWIRPCGYNVLGSDEEMINRLKKEYPDGVKVVLVNGNFAEAENESLDDCWTLTYNPLSDYIHFDPIGLLLTSIQDITTELVSLTLQTIEHGIPQTFADPQVLNFNQYSQTEVSPGSIFPAKAAAGKALQDGFLTIKTASLSGEVLPFMEKTQEAGQLVSGALPSLFGGAAPNSSKTAAQYAMSRAQALQRLQTPWKVLTFWWKNIFGKVIPSYIKEVSYDDKFVKRDESGNYLNVFIRKAEIEGKIGSVELEASEQLPLTWQQKRDIVMQLMQASNPQVMAALTSPENLPFLKMAIGLDDIIIPGEDDRQKQYEEIKILLDSEPIIDEMGNEVPSVDVEPQLDNHEVEADICRRWLIGDAGRLARTENPGGYRNVLIHMARHVNLHQMMMQMQQMQMQAPLQPNEENRTKPLMEKTRGNTATVQ